MYYFKMICLNIFNFYAVRHFSCYLKDYQIVHFKYVQFVVRQLYLNKVVKRKSTKLNLLLKLISVG